MHGLLHVNAPMWACRVVTLVPALIVLWFAKDPTQALVIGQVVLSIGIPFAVIPLMRYTHNKELMGKWADGTRQARDFYDCGGTDCGAQPAADCPDADGQGVIDSS